MAMKTTMEMDEGCCEKEMGPAEALGIRADTLNSEVVAFEDLVDELVGPEPQAAASPSAPLGVPTSKPCVLSSLQRTEARIAGLTARLRDARQRLQALR